MTRAFPATVWVRGEVQRLPGDAGGRQHVYFELHETGGSGAAEYQASVSLMGWDRQKFGLGRYLDGSDPDFQLANKLEVCLECRVDFYAKFGKLSLKVVGLDPSFSLGKLEARRREILAYLAANELLDLQAALHLPDLPLRVGLITAAGSAAEQDFLTGLDASPWAFRVSMRGAKMQGESLQAEVIGALDKLLREELDVIVITRGGGSRADLSWFDQKDLAEKIARCPLPIVTAIGHDIDRSIADLVSHRACKTPTAAAEFLVDRVEESAVRLDEAAERLAGRVQDLLREATRRVEVEDRIVRAATACLLRTRMHARDLAGRLQRQAAGRVAAQREKLAGTGVRIASLAVGRIATSRRWGEVLAGRLAREAPRPLIAAGRRLETLSVQTRLLDPDRLLRRGYTMTLDEAGKPLKEAGGLAAGDRITTRFQDGRVESIVQPTGAVKAPRRARKKTGGGKKPDNDSGNPSLF